MRISLFNFIVIALTIVVTTTTTCNAKRYRTKIAILGAGAAGISAASRIDQKGETDFLIVDAQPFIGGMLFVHVKN